MVNWEVLLASIDGKHTIFNLFIPINTQMKTDEGRKKWEEKDKAKII